ncbi:hypothetical protein PHMEG_000519 [Phytophthora megakarya]|uniref:Uncharacterized protein n=1 Tax=Phytophthora megakarya TaxID=4795 RepID=A0A225X548_9STRA|nr:hypothetical protein PHMEG_000519 [Phytophthora megakarya]
MKRNTWHLRIARTNPYFDELGYEQGASVINDDDNQACIAITEYPARHSRVKHIDLNDAALLYVISKDNLADAMTKGLSRDQHEYLRELMNVKSMGVKPGVGAQQRYARWK